MTVDSITLQIETPSGPVSPGRGFYQLEEESLFVQIGLYSDRHRFFSYLESDLVHFDLDREGRLLFLEVDYSRRLWTVVKHLKLPKRAEAADIRWLNFRDTIPKPEILTDTSKQIVKLEFSQPANPLYYYLGEQVIAETDRANNLTAVWIGSIIDDLAGREIKAYRQECRSARPYFS